MKREGREGEGEEGGGGGRSGSGELTRTKCSYKKVIALFPNSNYHTATQHKPLHTCPGQTDSEPFGALPLV